ncbi:Oidioi.mRNA.OKI2018_I69.XSR.g16566.t1.cds [Oikopleura dioica]|uniref:Oidioi.mRNA.OKI2018_I69.XSR.g16566.t1.cds n=1 Tax=Oikopleura dioica TaxID=34765 RepID=A0ABN7SKF4_OIKDI|nr:Oidioi.mRNA.OKI2018_I69.XSR.g16566.t1.cds [Oikopleura dioica]
MIFNWDLVIFSNDRDSLQIEHRKTTADVEALFDSFSGGLAPSRLLPGGQLFAAEEELVDVILKSSACDRDLLWCQIQSHRSNDLDARFIQLVLLAMNDDNFIDGVKGFWCKSGEDDFDSLAILVQKASQENQIERIQRIYNSLELSDNERIFFRTNRNFIEAHNWDQFRKPEEELPQFFVPPDNISDHLSDDDPFIRESESTKFRYLRAAFDDSSLNPGEVPELVAEANCCYDSKDFKRFQDELKFSCCFHEAGFIIKEVGDDGIMVDGSIIPPLVYSNYFQKMQACKVQKSETMLIDKSISTLWVRLVQEFTEEDKFPECSGIGFMRNSSSFAFVFCFKDEYSTGNHRRDQFDFQYFGKYLLEHELMRFKPIRRLNGDYEKIMRYMNFQDSTAGVLYEVKDPEIIAYEKENQGLKVALREANESVQERQISELFATRQDEHENKNTFLMTMLQKQEDDLKKQDDTMAEILNNLAEKESVINELESKIRNLENLTPKSMPDVELSPRPPVPPKRSRSVCSNISSGRTVVTKSLPATPEPALVTSPHFPGKVAPPEINFEEVQDLINTLESKNDKYLDDNRLLTKNIITKSSIISKLEEQVELMKLQNRTLVEKNVELARLQKLEEQKKQRPDQKMAQKVKTLEEELESERATLEAIKEKSEKSRNEIIQLNKGISRKIEQVRKLSSEVTQLKNERETFDEKQRKLHVKIDELEREKLELQEQNKKLVSSQSILLELGKINEEQNELNARRRSLWSDFCEASGKEVPLPAVTERVQKPAERANQEDSSLEDPNEALTIELQALRERLKALEEANSCPICQEQFDSEEARRCGISLCGHQFCVKCLLDLLKDSKKSHCPSCRVSFHSNNIIYLF